MYILGIDTSCDDTAIALLEVKNNNFKILSNVVSSQVKLHAKYGGVYPFLAKREHQRNLPIVFNKALRIAGFLNPKFEIRNPKQIQNPKYKIPNIDLIAVTIGPGLEPCLWQGINFAKDLAEKLKKPLISVNHIEAHILANFIDGFTKPIKFPVMCLVVSGGHTQLILMKKIGKYKLIGETRDDAAGECFDKVARILGLGYPGGPAIAAEAAKAYRDRISVQLPRPMMRQKNYDFSFSGLKTAVLYKVKSEKLPPSPRLRRASKTQNFIRAMAYETQQAIIDVLIHKALKAAKDFNVKSVILGGGVAANEELRRQFNGKLKIEKQPSGESPLGPGKFKFFVPPKNLCTDNAAMIAITAYFHQKNIKKDIEAQANLRI